MARTLIVEADGGSRGNPGPAAFGAVVRAGDTGEVLAEIAEAIGVASNNVAEYRGLIAGLRAAREIAPDASVDVRLDSKLIVEQMSGRWKIKHPDMQELAQQARAAWPDGEIRYTWVPRERNKHADSLVNAALDGRRTGTPQPPVLFEEEPLDAPPNKLVGWAHDLGEPTSLVLLRHGETEHTREKRFSGSGGADPALSDAGIEQAAAAARLISSTEDLRPSLVVTSPLTRARQTAEIVAAEVGCDLRMDEGLAECAFGEWEGRTFAEVDQMWPDELAAWLASTAVAPPGGESFDALELRLGRTRERLLATHRGETLVLVAHVTPIKSLVREALGAPPTSIYRMELVPASITTIAYFADGNRSLRSFNETAHLDGLLAHRHV